MMAWIIYHFTGNSKWPNWKPIENTLRRWSWITPQIGLCTSCSVSLCFVLVPVFHIKGEVNSHQPNSTFQTPGMRPRYNTDFHQHALAWCLQCVFFHYRPISGFHLFFLSVTYANSLSSPATRICVQFASISVFSPRAPHQPSLPSENNRVT